MRLLGPAAKIVQAVTTAVTPVLEAVRPKPTRPRRVPGERWIEDGREMTYWPDDRDEPDRIDYFAPGGVRRALDRMRVRPR